MVIVSCSGKFHAFNLAEQLDKNNLLVDFYTSYASFKNTFLKKIVKRQDKEKISPDKVHTFVPTAFGTKLTTDYYFWNNLFDKYVARKLAKRNDFEVFIGWSGMSLYSIRAAKKKGKKTIVERGSSHILYQEKILKEEYAKFGKPFNIDPRGIKKELQEYEEADIISIPSTFVKNTFLEYGVSEEKLFVNPYGVSSYFEKKEVAQSDKFIVLYLGSLTIRKGLIYLFEALHQLNIPDSQYEAWFIGEIDDEMQDICNKYKKENWKFFGKIDHYKLAHYISQCDVMVQPSIEEGLSMVIAQVLSCGVPVIATENTGGKDIIDDGNMGFIIPARSAKAISTILNQLYAQPQLLANLKNNLNNSSKPNFTWEQYGERYKKLINILK